MRDAAPVSRLQAMRDKGRHVTMPPLSDAARPIVEHLLDCGPALPGAMGVVALTYSEIRAYQDATGLELTPGEARMLRRASQAYVAESRDAEDIDAPAPWISTDDEKRAAVSKRIGSVFGAMAKKAKR